MVESIYEVLPPILHKVIFAGGHFGGVLFGLAIVPSAVWHEILSIEGIGLVEGEFIVIHWDDKFIGSRCIRATRLK